MKRKILLIGAIICIFQFFYLPLGSAKRLMPEYIFKAPPMNYYFRLKGVIFSFTSPAGAKGIGQVAAQLLYMRLLKRGVFEEIISEIERGEIGQEEQLRITKERGYDLIINGKVLCCFDGRPMFSTRATEEFKVFDVKNGNLLWHAMAVGISEPIEEKDYIFYRRKAKSSLSIEQLLEINAEKFINLLLYESPEIALMTKDMKMVEAGFHFITIKDYERAMLYFKEALEINPQNPYAYLNLGYIYQNTGRPKDAEKMYKKVLEINPADIIRDSTDPTVVGMRLVDLAKRNLQELKLK